MILKCGIIGLPNVGKSTLFNALTASNLAVAKNYPFCTIEPNVGIVEVPDQRLHQLAKNAGSKEIIPAFIEFVDIAGLVKNASKGEGQGNKFLSHIRQVDAIIHVLRCFVDDNIIHVYNKIDPEYDAEIVETELIIADLESVEKRLSNKRSAKQNDTKTKDEAALLIDCKDCLSQGKPARSLLAKYSQEELKLLQLLTAKPVLYVCNVLESEAASGNKYTEAIATKARLSGADSVIISSKIEAEIASFTPEEQQEFLESINLAETGLSKIIKSAYNLLNLSSFFTVGPKEAHAWTFTNGTKAREAAGIIHSDFARGFIRAEVISYDELLKIGSETRARESGKIRSEGKEYVMQDGDVVHFRFNV